MTHTSAQTTSVVFGAVLDVDADGDWKMTLASSVGDILVMHCSSLQHSSRIWECSIDGTVMKTHKFKMALENKQAINFNCIQSYEQDLSNVHSMRHEINEQLVNLQVISKSLVLGHTTNIFYIFDFIQSTIVLWFGGLGGIHTLKVCDDTIFIFTNDHKAFSVKLKRLDDRPEDEDNYEKYDNIEEYHENLKYSIEQIDAPSPQIEFESKTCTEDIRNLFFIYKSLKTLGNDTNIFKERYAELFDNYDLDGIKQMLNALQDMILENEYGITEFEAKKICANIYLTYVNSNELFLHDSEGFVTDSLIRVNSQNTVTNATQRCQLCNFPLTLMPATTNTVKFTEILKFFIGKFVNRNEDERVFNIIDEIPTAMMILLEVINNFNGNFDISNLYFHYFLHPDAHIFHTYDFARLFLSRLILLHDEMVIECVRCRAHSKVTHIDPKYQYDNVFQHCLGFLSPITILRLLNELANFIPANAISRKFFVKCLLKNK